MSPRLTLVVAVARNGVIGREGDLPWLIKDDLKWFKSVTMGKPVIMGRTTYESIGKPLPGRQNVVLTSRPDRLPQADGLTVVSTIDAALGAIAGAAEACLIGGATLYRQMLPLTDRLVLTVVEASPKGDTHFPYPAVGGSWAVRQVGQIAKSARNEHAARFEQWDRVDPSAVR